MPTTLGTLRRVAMAPSFDAVSFAGRGFPARRTAATTRLEAVPQAVVCGFEWGIEVRGLGELTRRLALVDAEQRGFAYEGATMALTIRDALPGGGRGRAHELLAGPAVPHTFLTYIGIGFAMARLPRPLWRGVLPDLTGTPYYPTMSWLAVDGYGFDRAYFDTERWVTRQELPKPYPWLGRPDYFPRAFDQGVGRALWFINGGCPAAVAAAVGRFDSGRHADLWSGVGLAAAFAGGWDETGPAELRRLAGSCRTHVAQGAVFAAKARVFAGFVPPHLEPAVRALAGLTVAEAVALADEVAEAGFAGEAEPDYEVWRERIRVRCVVDAGIQG